MNCSWWEVQSPQHSVLMCSLLSSPTLSLRWLQCFNAIQSNYGGGGRGRVLNLLNVLRNLYGLYCCGVSRHKFLAYFTLAFTITTYFLLAFTITTYFTLAFTITTYFTLAFTINTYFVLAFTYSTLVFTITTYFTLAFTIPTYFILAFF